MERPAAHQGCCALTLVDAPAHQTDEEGDDGQLDHHDQAIEVGYQVDAAQVEEGHHCHQTEDENPGINSGEHGGQVDLGQQDIDHRHEHVVEQGRPAHHETDVGVEHLLGIGIGRARRGELAHQMAVAERGQQYAAQRQQIGSGDPTFGNVTDDGEGIEHGHGGQIGKAHHHHLPHAEGFLQTNGLLAHSGFLLARAAGSGMA